MTLNCLAQMPDSPNRPKSSLPGFFQQQIKGFVGPLSVASAFPPQWPEWAFMGETLLGDRVTLKTLAGNESENNTS